MADNTAIGILTREITSKVTADLTARFEGAVSQFNAEVVSAQTRADELFNRLEAEGQRRMNELFANIPVAAVITEDGDFDPIGWIKSQAKSRAWRTLLQGLFAVVLVAAGNVVTQSIANPDFNAFSWDDWKVVGALAGTAVLTGLVSYVQNSFGIKPPKVQ
ncbi:MULTISPECIES: hypothetical protein [unclassified Rhodococcus (in: high G+C Gram-positive bacteria)]|uniref:hypothetical protein n=1 Tax=unclassified Rhodococcus (in: high G+C Gram-positive bacteria) TaxID=192944 RepID=UPI000B9C4DAD|nr:MULTISPECIES: hypothetical protein [unclassified Rhodococcus (in: high G+C Gram-positive bacteria)]OZE35595.1 hypothetical protein CH259_16330 [Rhodococcus sp. 05-2254-4]OZE48024.1 hypothetical protein CH261_08925 [Rhodococcus sp. 05-2254-3]OZE49235.1 hypothetical protein CH283_16710 [Rhodococcus sp. 05-2254-2]